MNPRERGQKLIDALLSGRDEDAKQVLKDKVDFTLENRGDNAIHLAARHGRLEIIKLMQSLGANLEQKNVHGNVAMHYAAKGGYLDLVKYLKANGANLNIQNKDGESPLHEAVKTQTMDTIETLVDLGMEPNCKNKKDGDTPLHTALKYGAAEAMEGLLIKGAAANRRNNDERKPEDVAKTIAIKECLRMYATMLIAMSSGYIKAKGMKITRDSVLRNPVVDRVGIIIDRIDIPKEFPTGFYCRREKAENATVALKKYEEETIFSDIYHIRIFDVNRDCQTKIRLPVFKSPSEKEQMVVHFLNTTEEDKVVEDYKIENKTTYCTMETVLIPETTCICMVNVRARREENKVSEEGATITSDMEKDFSLEVPQGSFEGETVLSLTVFETNPDDFADEEEELDKDTQEDEEAGQGVKEKKKVKKSKSRRKSSIRSNSVLEEEVDTVDQAVAEEPEPQIQNLLTDVYQINVEGQQPKKGVKIQIPLCKGMETEDEISILATDEKRLGEEDAIEVLDTTPKIVNCNLIFEVSHFSIYVASWKKKASSKEERVELQRQISSARDKRKPAAIFAVVKQTEGLKHVLVVSCVVANKSSDCRRKWIDSEGYEEQNPPEAGPISMTPGEIYCVDIEGNASLEDKDDAKERKIQFSQFRSSWQPYNMNLHEGIYDPDQASAHVILSKKTDTGLEETTRLRIKLTPPPRPPTPPPPTPPPPTPTQMSKGSILSEKANKLGRPAKSKRGASGKTKTLEESLSGLNRSTKKTTETVKESVMIWPKELLDARTALLPYLKAAEKKGHNAALIGNKLYVNGRLTVSFKNGEIKEKRKR